MTVTIHRRMHSNTGASIETGMMHAGDRIGVRTARTVSTPVVERKCWDVVS